MIGASPFELFVGIASLLAGEHIVHKHQADSTNADELKQKAPTKKVLAKVLNTHKKSTEHTNFL